MQGAAPAMPMPGAGRALILCAAEHGFVGGFNEHLLDTAEAALATDDALFVLGSRGATLALERGRQEFWTRPMATRLAGIPDTINHLTAELYARIARGELSHLDVMFARYRQGGAPTIERNRLLPFDAASPAVAQPRLPPLHNLEPRALLERLMAEYVFARLTEAAVESLASENAARFAAMDSARDNVAKKLRQLQQDARQARQTEITAELLDLVTGTEGLLGRARVA
jgi:F-type H+-transporting ATPase subunit gamma